jgi:transcriptional regulator with XRE-family HTH domain
MAAVATEGPGKAAWLDALGALIRAQRVTAGLSLRELAERTKVSNAYLSQIERGLHEPSISVLGAIAAALDVSLEALLARAGLLVPEGADERAAGALVRDTEAAILGDPELSEAQRVALLSIYRSFVPARRRSRAD